MKCAGWLERRSKLRLYILWLEFAACLLLAACAQTGPPLPPSLELPKAPTDLRASRKGNSVTLAWTEPARTTDRRTVRYLGPTNICRTLAAELNDCGRPVAATPAPPARSKLQKTTTPPTETFKDDLPETMLEQNPTGEVTYAIEVLNQDGRSAGLSNRARVPAVPVLAPPSDVSAQLNDDGVVLSWTGEGETAQASVVQHRYRIYRRDEASGKDAVAGDVPLEQPGATRFLDASLEWERTYLYRVTVVSVLTHDSTETQVEGEDSAAVRVVAHDVFPPAVPGGLQAVYSGEGQKPFVDLIWAPVTNADLAGYSVYRRDGSGSWMKMNSDLVKSPSYRDSAVEPGKTYVYSVTAIDVRGNESARSEEARETVPEHP